MKKLSILVLTICLVGSINLAQAQKADIIINEISEHMSQGVKPGFEVAILDMEPKKAKEGWIKGLKKYKAKVISSKKSIEIVGDNAMLPTVSANTIDIYAIPSKQPYGTRLAVFVDLGGSFISSADHPVAFMAFESFLRDHANAENIRTVEFELEREQDALKSLNKELDGLVKDKDEYQQEIEKAKALIAEREEEIVDNVKAQETKRQQIEIQNEIIKTISEKRRKLDF